MESPDTLFVYGTLLTGTGNRVVDGAMRRARDLGKAWVPGRLYDLGSYPGAVPSLDPRERVLGRIYGLPGGSHLGAVWKALDRYEDCGTPGSTGGVFQRAVTQAFTAPGGREVDVWVYWYRRSVRGCRRIPSGEYSKRRIWHGGPDRPRGVD